MTGGRALPCKAQGMGEAALAADLITAFRSLVYLGLPPNPFPVWYHTISS